MVHQTITKITSSPEKSKSAWGNWKVLANTHFKNEYGKEWDYPNKIFHFWTKKKALGFIHDCNAILAQGENPAVI